MQVRFDGTLGFPGGVMDEGETPDHACSRECWEELGVSEAELVITPDDHIFTHYSDKTHIILHFYAKELPLHLFREIEKRVPSCNDWGDEASSFGKRGVPIVTIILFRFWVWCDVHFTPFRTFSVFRPF